PIYISDYVINSYATGMVMGVPAHDQRDYEFAKKFNIDIIPVIDGDISEHAFEEDGVHINSGFMNGLKKQEAMQKGLEHIIKDNIGTKFTTTKLHDWTFSRQRYWGEPFPIIYDEKNIPQLVSFSDLPVVLPKFEDYNFEKKGTYVNPLENAESWKKLNINGKEFRRETDTMPGSAGSSWYWIAYVLKNSNGTYEKIDSAEGQRRIKRWLPVDTYIGGKEHTTGHVLYARFWNMFLFNIGMVNTPEFFKTRIDHGLILAEDGRKMSKRWGNVINPTDIIESHGADALRTYCAFIGPIDGTYPWKSSSVDGIRKWLDRVYNLFASAIEIVNDESKISNELNIAFNVFVKNITKNMEERKHNIAISDMMVYINECYKNKVLLKNHLEGFLVILGCFAPFLAEELNEQILKNNSSISKGSWPKYEESLTQSNVVNLPIQVDGKLRATIVIKLNTNKEEIIEQALTNENVSKHITNGYQNIIYVPNKILSIISKK
ncbi:MAG: class I tRNA ligase family protein, partial [Mycoplasmataceae bacterium]|nr:class I tRNA ligase family protein [Mycoplasmataceae bacterium]